MDINKQQGIGQQNGSNNSQKLVIQINLFSRKPQKTISPPQPPLWTDFGQPLLRYLALLGGALLFIATGCAFASRTATESSFTLWLLASPYLLGAVSLSYAGWRFASSDWTTLVALESKK